MDLRSGTALSAGAPASGPDSDLPSGTDSVIAERVAAARRGRTLWLELQRKHEVDGGRYVLLMPEDDPELNETALGRVTDLVAGRRARGVVVVTDQPVVAEAVSSPDVVDVETVTTDQVDDLLALCELYQFTERLLVVSPSRPAGRRLDLLERAGVAREDLVGAGMLGITAA